jgi:hypothetical protein
MNIKLKITKKLKSIKKNITETNETILMIEEGLKSKDTTTLEMRDIHKMSFRNEKDFFKNNIILNISICSFYIDITFYDLVNKEYFLCSSLIDKGFYNSITHLDNF